jgi:hypothetical protein
LMNVFPWSMIVAGEEDEFHTMDRHCVNLNVS